MSLTPPIIPGIIESRKKGDTSDFEWRITIQTEVGSANTEPLNLTGTSLHRFQVQTKDGVALFDLGASIVNAVAGTMRCTPQLVNVSTASAEPYWGQHTFISATGKVETVPAGAWWEVRIIPTAF